MSEVRFEKYFLGYF